MIRRTHYGWKWPAPRIEPSKVDGVCAAVFGIAAYNPSELVTFAADSGVDRIQPGVDEISVCRMNIRGIPEYIRTGYTDLPGDGPEFDIAADGA